MAKHVSDYLISAYIDGRVTEAERQVVERALHESAEHREVYEQLVALRRDLQRLPKSAAPADLADRVMDRIAGMQPSPAGSSDTVWWRQKVWRRTGWGLVAVAAALAFIAWFIAPRLPERETVQKPSRHREATESVVAPSVAESPGTRDDRLAVTAEGRRDTYVFVVDVAIPPAGQAGQVFTQALRNAGIAVAPDMRVDERLEQKLLENRFVGDVQPVKESTNQPKPGEATVEMVYVSGTGREIEAAIADLRSRPPNQVAHIRFDMALEPEQRDLFRQLHRATQMASDQTTPQPTARRLVFRFVLRGTAGGSLGTISFPAIRAEWEPATSKAAELSSEPTSQPKAAERSVGVREEASDATARATPLPITQPSGAASEQPGEDTLYEVLFILRKLDRPSAPAPALP